MDWNPAVALSNALDLRSVIGSDKHSLKRQRQPISVSAKCRKHNGQRWHVLAVGSYQAVLRALEARHLRTRPYTPRTNGKAERFIETCLQEWANRCPYLNSAVRAAALPRFLQRYNVERPHTSLQRRPPLAYLLEPNE